MTPENDHETRISSKYRFGFIRPLHIYAFQNKYGYGQRSLVEAQISRIKRCLGARLLTCKIESQQREGVIIANVLNLWNSFGRPVCVKNG